MAVASPWCMSVIVQRARSHVCMKMGMCLYLISHIYFMVSVYVYDSIHHTIKLV